MRGTASSSLFCQTTSPPLAATPAATKNLSKVQVKREVTRQTYGAKRSNQTCKKKWILKNHGQWKQSWKKKSQSEWILIKNKKQRETIVYIKQSSFKAWSQNRVKWFGMLPDFPHQRALSSSRLVKDQNYKKMFGVHWHHEACNTDWRSLPENVLDMHVFLNIF